MPVTGGRGVTIDLLRGGSILMVMLLHFSLTYHLAEGPLAAVFTPSAIEGVVDQGNFGVTIFFVVSGYLITAGARRRYGWALDVGAFYWMRASRILPLLLTAVAIIGALALAGVPSFAGDGGARTDGWAFVSVLTFWHNVFMQTAGYTSYCLDVYWSLSVEEVFYLLFPAAFLLLARTRWALALPVALIVAGPVYRAAHTDDEIRFLYANWACFDALAIGCLTALVAAHVRMPPGVARAGVAAGAAVIAAVWWRRIDGHEAFGFSEIAAAAALVIVAGPHARVRLWCAPLTWMGRHSYELYLFHVIVLAALRDALPRWTGGAQIALLATYFALACAAAAVMAPLGDAARVRLRGYRRIRAAASAA